MPLTNYILDADGNPVPEPDFLAWGRWFGDSQNRRVAETWIEDIMVSTVFLCIDHNFSDEGPPVLWETMIFNVPLHLNDIKGYQERYSSRQDAVEGHRQAVWQVMLALGLDIADEPEPLDPPAWWIALATEREKETT